MDPVTVDRAKLEELLSAAESSLEIGGVPGWRHRLELALEDVRFDLASRGDA
jgi:hypothetical protein